MLVGSHLYGLPIDQITTSDIELGQHKATGRPTEGLRFVYIPMEATDFEYYPTEGGQAAVSGTPPIPFR
jgi:hypothetical protein